MSDLKLLFETLLNSGTSKSNRSKFNTRLKENGFSDTDIRTARACLNNTLNDLNEIKSQKIIDYYNKNKDNLNINNYKNNDLNNDNDFERNDESYNNNNSNFKFKQIDTSNNNLDKIKEIIIKYKQIVIITNNQIELNKILEVEKILENLYKETN